MTKAETDSWKISLILWHLKLIHFSGNLLVHRDAVPNHGATARSAISSYRIGILYRFAVFTLFVWSVMWSWRVTLLQELFHLSFLDTKKSLSRDEFVLYKLTKKSFRRQHNSTSSAVMVVLLPCRQKASKSPANMSMYPSNNSDNTKTVSLSTCTLSSWAISRNMTGEYDIGQVSSLPCW